MLSGFPVAPCLAMPGNGCGHDPAQPRFYAASPRLDSARLPKIITRTIEALERIFTEPGLIPTLAAANQSERQQRSERREAVAALLGALVQYTDLTTLKVGRPGPDGTAGLRMVELADLAGLSLRRAERAMHDLKAAGLVRVHPIAEKQEDGSYTGLAAIRTISKHLWGVLGMGAWLSRERKAAHKRGRTKADPVSQARAGLALQMARDAIDGKLSPREQFQRAREALNRANRPGAPPGS